MVKDTTSDASIKLAIQAATDYFNLNKNSLSVKSIKSEGLYPCLSKAAKGTALLGESVLDKALVRQWIQFEELMFRSKKDLATLHILNQGLEKSTFLAGEKVTFADFLLFYSLLDLMKEFTYQEKESILHVSRWFVNLQTVLPSSGISVQLSRTTLY